MHWLRRRNSIILGGLILLISSFSFAAGPQPPEADVTDLAPEYSFPEEAKTANLGRLYQAAPADSAHDYDVTKYILDVKLVPTSPTNKLRGHTTIQAKSQISGLSTLVLDFIGMTVDSCKVNSSSAIFTRSSTQLFVDLGTSYGAGSSFSADVFYHGNPVGGFYFTSNSYGSPVYYSFTEPYDSRLWFPCYDWPNDKARCEVICTVPAGYFAVSNGRLYSVTNNPDTTTTYLWKENYQIATYLISVTVCDYAQIDTYAVVETDTIPVQYWVYPQDSLEAVTDFKKTPKMIEYFSDIWLNYPFPGDKYSMAQAELGGAMEHQTCTSWGFPMPGDARYEWVVAHELAHQWWGDLVTCSDFANIWLNEGFASYAEALWQEYEYGPTAFKNHLIAFEGNIFASRFGSVKYPIYNPPSTYLFGTAVYKKGAWVLHMLRYLLGDSNFFNGMQAYGQSYAYSTANTEQFQTAIEGYSGMDLDLFFNQWVYSPNYPILNWSWTYTSIGTTYYLDVNLNQKQTTPLVFKLPLEFRLSTLVKDSLFTILDTLRNQHFSMVLKSPITGLVFDPNYWVLSADTLTAYPYRAGDLDGNTIIVLNDIIYLVNILFHGFPLPVPAAAADVNGDCKVSLGDVVYFINYFFHSGPQLKLGCPG